MTAKPKPRKPATLLELAAKLDTEKARYEQMRIAGRAEAETCPVLSRIYRLEERISKVRATNLAELKLKARAACFVPGDYDPDYDHCVAELIVRDILKLPRG